MPWRTIAVVFLLFFVITRPASAAALVHKGLHQVARAGGSVGTFVSSL
jgi:hypothetical protein